MLETSGGGGRGKPSAHPTVCPLIRIYSWIHENGSFSVHSFKEHYLSIPQETGTVSYPKYPVIIRSIVPIFTVKITVLAGGTVFRIFCFLSS